MLDRYDHGITIVPETLPVFDDCGHDSYLCQIARIRLQDPLYFVDFSDL